MATATGLLCALVLSGSAAVAHGSLAHHTSNDDRQNIVEIAVGSDSLTTLVAALTAAELVDDVQNATGITVLAPTDAAFGELDQRALQNTIENHPTGRLADVLKYHVIPERLTAAELVKRRFVTTLDGQRLEINITGSGLELNDASIVAADIEAENGIVHVIDTVLIPAKDNIAEVAQNAGTFETLLAAVGAANLAEFVSTTDPITVFAPTDDAFAELGAEKIAELLKPENRETLVEILSYHVVPGRVYGGDLFEASAIDAVAGGALKPSVRNGSIFINDSQVVAPNIDAANGVVHAIDSVLIPESFEVSSATPLERNEPATRVLTLAIERGVPLFNDGQTAACAAIYEVAIASVLALEGGLDQSQRNTLQAALNNGRSERNAAERAWVFRRGMDGVLPASDRPGAMVTSGRRASH
ncbi:MAG: fasciclin domain-containing protein [Planctomycetota bacterium]